MPGLHIFGNAVGVLLLGAVMTTTEAQALDQSWEFADRSYWASVGDGRSVRQTITVGTTGTLTGFDVLYVSRWENVGEKPLVVELYDPNDPDGNEPDRIAFFTVQPTDIAPSGLNEPLTNLSFELNDPNWHVDAGETLYLSLGSDSPVDGGGPGGRGAGYLWVFDGSMSSLLYPGGRAEDTSPGGSWQPIGSDPWSFDFGFRTYVEPIPEPTSIALLGLAILAIRCRR